jgi:hypothetical protein
VLLALLGAFFVASSSAAADLVVAVDPEGPTDPAALSFGRRPHREPPPAQPVVKGPRKLAYAGSLLLVSGTANEDFDVDRVAVMARPALEMYLSVPVGSLEFIVGGTTLAIEAYAYAHRTSLNYPAMVTMGLQGSSFLVQIAGGASLFSADSEGRFARVDDEIALPAPRVELRAGYRVRDVLDVRGILGTERRLTDGGDVSRTYLAVALGLGGTVR